MITLKNEKGKIEGIRIYIHDPQATITDIDLGEESGNRISILPEKLTFIERIEWAYHFFKIIK